MKLNINGETIETLLYRENRPVLELKIAYPQIMGPLSKKSEYNFNEFYRRQARSLNVKARTEFYMRASEEARLASEQEFDFTLHSYLRTYSVPRLDRQFTSVVFDRYQYCGGPHGTTIRKTDTWDFSVGRKIPLSHFFQKSAPYKKVLLHEIENQIGEQQKKEEVLFFENPLRNARIHFNEMNFYLTGNSITVFYPAYTLAPYYAGILTYKIPFSYLTGMWNKEKHPSEVKGNESTDSPLFGKDLL